MFAWARGLSNIYAHEHLASKLSAVYAIYTYDWQCVSTKNINHDSKAISSLMFMIYNGDPPRKIQAIKFTLPKKRPSQPKRIPRPPHLLENFLNSAHEVAL